MCDLKAISFVFINDRAHDTVLQFHISDFVLFKTLQSLVLRMRMCLHKEGHRVRVFLQLSCCGSLPQFHNPKEAPGNPIDIIIKWCPFSGSSIRKGTFRKLNNGIRMIRDGDGLQSLPVKDIEAGEA